MAFATAAAALTLLLFTAAFVVARAKRSTLERLGEAAPTMKRWGGSILLLVGAWFAVLGIWAGTFSEIFPV